jgi:hypothetical protein
MIRRNGFGGNVMRGLAWTKRFFHKVADSEGFPPKNVGFPSALVGGGIRFAFPLPTVAYAPCLPFSHSAPF